MARPFSCSIIELDFQTLEETFRKHDKIYGRYMMVYENV